MVISRRKVIITAIAVGLLAAQPIGAQPHLTTLRGNTHPLATRASDRGPVPDTMLLDGMWLLLKRPPDRERAFLDFLAAQQDPASPRYHQWLTARQLGEQFGPSQEDIAAATQWLESAGFKVNLVYPHGTLIDFSGTASQIRQAFHTEMHYFDVNGKRHFANTSDPQIPASLEPVIAGPVSLHNFMPRHFATRTRPSAIFNSLASPSPVIVPGDIATIYNLNPAFAAGYTGSGVTIVVVEDTDVYTTADWGIFRKEFGLARSYPQGSYTQLHPAPPKGGTTCRAPGVNGDDGEAILDAEWASAAAPNAAIVSAACADTTQFGGFIALQNMLTNGGSIPPVVSISYGEAESLLGSAENSFITQLYQQAAAAGVSLFVSSGDSAAAGADQGSEATGGIQVSGFASTVFNVAVGGTDFGDTANHVPSGTYWSSTPGTYFNAALSYIQEIPWNDSCASVLIAQYYSFVQTYGSTGFCNSSTGESTFLNVIGGSGGPSSIYTKPVYQIGFTGNPADGKRDVPDVALFAANGVWGHYYVVCYSDPSGGGSPCTGVPSTWSGFGGTSISSPIMAGIMALVVQKKGLEGNPLSRLYSLAGSTYGGASLSQCNSTSGTSVGSSCVFYDVTQGDMDVPCTGSLNCYRPSGTYGVLSTSNAAYQPAYGTGTGWDFATGIGTVNAYNFVTRF